MALCRNGVIELMHLSALEPRVVVVVVMSLKTARSVFV